MIVWLLYRVKIIVANGEIAKINEQFLILPRWFQKLSDAEASICGKGLNASVCLSGIIYKLGNLEDKKKLCEEV